MICYIPIALGQIVPEIVWNSFPTDVFPIVVASDGEINSQGCNNTVRLSGEPRSRNMCVEMHQGIAAFHGPYVAMQDRDCKHLAADGFQRAVDYLDTRQELDAVALPWRDRFAPGAHVRILCVVFRTEVFCRVVFRRELRKCCCACLGEDIRIEYLPSDSKLCCEINTHGLC